MPARIVNIAAYKFVSLDRLSERRKSLYAFCQQRNLKGTILLSAEGINLFLAGIQNSIEEFIRHLREKSEFTDLDIKESHSDHQPFNRLLVKLKREIIPFGIQGIEPASHPSRRLAAEKLKQWLDEGVEITLLDVRNDYEIEVGTFENAVPIGIGDFRNLPAAVEGLPSEIRKRPVVTFCTGGIRCEKAAPYLEQCGFSDVYQLDGGILRYFEKCGSAHYHGECFVFDKRVALDAKLHETDTEFCFVCQAILSPQDLTSPHYTFGESCPHCFVLPEERLRALCEKRHTAIQTVSDPLPGSQPYTNERPLRIPHRLEGHTAIDVLVEIQNRLTHNDWKIEFSRQRLEVEGQPISADYRVRAGERIVHSLPATVEPDVSANIKVIFEDDSIVVVNKPAPLPMHPAGRFNRNTLGYILAQAYAPQRLRPAHRLDANTTGPVVFSKTRQIAAKLQKQFEQGQVQKEYLVRVAGHLPQNEFSSSQPISEHPGQGGARLPSENGAPAHTEFSVLQRFDDNTTLLRAIPQTGRTNQIRVHLWNLNVPVCGDPLYLPQGDLGVRSTVAVDDPPMCLHAHRIAFLHPVSQAACHFDVEAPNWARYSPKTTF